MYACGSDSLFFPSLGWRSKSDCMEGRLGAHVAGCYVGGIGFVILLY